MPQVIAGQAKIRQCESSPTASLEHSQNDHLAEYRPTSGRWVPKGLVFLLVLLVVGVVNACAYQINAEKYALQAASQAQGVLSNLDPAGTKSKVDLMTSPNGAATDRQVLAERSSYVAHPYAADLLEIPVNYVSALYDARYPGGSTSSEIVSKSVVSDNIGPSTRSLPCYRQFHRPTCVSGDEYLNANCLSYEFDVAQRF